VTKRLSARKVETIRTPGYHADGEGLYCSPSALLRQIEGFHEGRISGSS
jgi:hypothetical protein